MDFCLVAKFSCHLLPILKGLRRSILAVLSLTRYHKKDYYNSNIMCHFTRNCIIRDSVSLRKFQGCVLNIEDEGCSTRLLM